MTCASDGFMQTAFYRRESSILGSNKKCWRSDEIGKEVEINIVLWDYFPENPYQKINEINIFLPKVYGNSICKW